MEKNNRWKAVVYVLLGAASYGVLSTVVKLAYAGGFTAAEVTGSQVLLGCAAMWLLSAPYWNRIREISVISMLKMIGSGVFTGLTGIFYYQSLQHLDASFAVLLLFQFTWMGMALEWLLHGKRPGRPQAAGAVVVWVGTLLASGLLEGRLAGKVGWLGIALGLISAVCYTLFIYFSGKVAVEVPPSLRSAWMLAGAALVVSIVYPPHFLWNGALLHGLWGWAVVLGLFGMVLPPYLFAKGAPKLNTGLTAILGSVELPVVLICSSLLLQESSDAAQWIGVALILGGIVISEWYSRLEGKLGSLTS
ncbi:EamA family transporter [Paenibacillus validus]|uniref:EamA family transporter n=1 Tax=Paenibacillus validus TaxID=44253 RepID=A0A7X3CQT7_9BACL|nr:DMT family transporter [Paenibacillus validus]MUG69532.1 EamA family transporter [Paenibacillus validus]